MISLGASMTTGGGCASDLAISEALPLLLLLPFLSFLPPGFEAATEAVAFSIVASSVTKAVSVSSWTFMDDAAFRSALLLRSSKRKESDGTVVSGRADVSVSASVLKVVSGEPGDPSISGLIFSFASKGPDGSVLCFADTVFGWMVSDPFNADSTCAANSGGT
ncbi:hypothetical protein BD324DRAFT_617185 [Kockovaella imperatae]|uniref:Secreted protein n=1 Tax=Kockovaella imperatae TaxID=4999 RepID=A0A1Y1US48_9TREE|nr:hypothetical protein BD324DRAFT_617185 [Kockovaella imperatae]ORX40286.1 hypothetical protein BD324DRAFT_617185 [Kockovaella imperatae]